MLNMIKIQNRLSKKELKLKTLNPKSEIDLENQVVNKPAREKKNYHCLKKINSLMRIKNQNLKCQAKTISLLTEKLKVKRH